MRAVLEAIGGELEVILDEGAPVDDVGELFAYLWVGRGISTQLGRGGGARGGIGVCYAHAFAGDEGGDVEVDEDVDEELFWD